MCGIVIDAVILMVILMFAGERDIGFFRAAFAALVWAVGTTLLSFALGAMLGIIGVLVAAVIGAALLGLAVSIIFGVALKRALIIAGIFLLVHIGVYVAAMFLLRT